MRWFHVDEWSGLKSNLVKLGLGSVSMFFDILFMIQHYVLYPNHEEPAPSTRLLDDVEKYDVAHISSNNLQAVKTPYSSLLTNNPYTLFIVPFHYAARDQEEPCFS